MRRYDAVTLDAYGTLVRGGSDETIAVLTELAEASGGRVTARALLEAREDLIRELERRDFVTIRERDRWIFGTLAREHALDADVEALVARVYRAYSDVALYEDALPAVRALRAAGVPLAIVSNSDDAIMAAIAKRLGLAEHMAALVTSERARCYKPAPGIYAEAARALGVPPARILHVGDSFVADVVGAKRAGFGGAAWLDRPGGLPAPERREAEPDAVVASLDAVAGLVR